jgi:transcriptional regulator with GAF, ATPase, and Fis domain
MTKKVRCPSLLRPLQRNGGNVAAAARELELQVTYLHRLIRNLDVRDRSAEQGH